MAAVKVTFFPADVARKVTFKCADTSTSAEPPRRGGKTLAHGEAVGILTAKMKQAL
jgi:hypothetical protein